MKFPQPVGFVMDAYDSFSRLASYAQSPLLLAVRLYWGWQLAQNGWGKLHNLLQVTSYFASLGIPFPSFTTTFVAGVEFIGGFLLIVGLFSRITGLVVAIDMFVAYWAADRVALKSIFSDPSKFYVADPYTFLFAAVLILIFGAGLFSLDRLIARLTAPWGISIPPPSTGSDDNNILRCRSRRAAPRCGDAPLVGAHEDSRSEAPGWHDG